jgi:hypothetical protein
MVTSYVFAFVSTDTLDPHSSPIEPAAGMGPLPPTVQRPVASPPPPSPMSIETCTYDSLTAAVPRKQLRPPCPIVVQFT